MAEEENNAGADEAQAAKGKRKLLPLILVALVVLGGAGAAGWFFLLAPGDEAHEEEDSAHAEEEAHGEPHYFTLAENLVVNFRSSGGARFLQVGIDVMTYDTDGLHALEKHAPVLQSGLILLLSDQTQENLLSREGKEALREQALAEVRHEMEKLHGEPVVESLFFTSFVMQ